MYVEHTINDLIETGWSILDARKDEAAASKWKTQALDCLTSLLGPDHIYVSHLKDFFQESRERQSSSGDRHPDCSERRVGRKSKNWSGVLRMQRDGRRWERSYEN